MHNYLVNSNAIKEWKQGLLVKLIIPANGLFEKFLVYYIARTYCNRVEEVELPSEEPIEHELLEHLPIEHENVCSVTLAFLSYQMEIMNLGILSKTKLLERRN